MNWLRHSGIGGFEIQLVVSESKKYASSKEKLDFRVCPDEMKIFLEIFLVSGYRGCKRRRSYWSGEDDVRNEAIANAMARDRFDEIMRYFHIADNSRLDQADKFYKMESDTEKEDIMSNVNPNERDFFLHREMSISLALNRILMTAIMRSHQSSRKRECHQIQRKGNRDRAE
ncbi:PiggyBac transposable element-derived protein 3 [Elysia marginata]|uniref:PiggyBac transposable element-derived protein 3 n=1 Tax=Elysia marginata TaxID=1093978 RepID=A0AAV4IZR8_9GAST|nr:PiggyBac transposable element-derived protein 3 [Elysia marginata]